MIVAGAGTGKTTVLTHKIKFLIEELGFPPSALLAITFTNKAAREMQERVRRMSSHRREQPYVSTFHAFCADVLRRDFDKIGGNNRFAIFDTNDQKRLLKEILKRLNIDEKLFPAARFMGAIESLKNEGKGPTDLQSRPVQNPFDKWLAIVYDTYQKELWRQSGVDFNDLIFYTNQIFEKRPDVLAEYQARFLYVLVDEYQDTNHAQLTLVRHLAQNSGNLAVVGDFDQNIYSWRGANLENMLSFEKVFQGGITILLEQNYRSTQMILDAANALIKNNQQRREKRLWTENDPGEKMTVLMTEDEHQEASTVIEEIKKLKKEGMRYSDMVIIYRVNALSRVFEDRLAAAQIPYQIVGGLRFYERKEIKDLIGYLRLIANDNDDAAFLRICNIPARDIGQTTVKTLALEAANQGVSMMNRIAQGNLPLAARAVRALNSFADLIIRCQKFMETPSPIEMGQTSEKRVKTIADLIAFVIAESGYETMLKNEGTNEAEERLENIREFLSFAHEEILDLQEFVHKLSLMTDIDESQLDEDRIMMMTIHHTKGLEFDTVFVAGFEEGMLPHYRALQDESEMEEERRLCYVAITRSKRKLYLTGARKRIIFGDVWMQKPSRFLEEIPAEILEHREKKMKPDPHANWLNNESHSGTGRKPDAMSEDEQLNLQIGDWVRHAVWGPGRVLKIEGSGENAILHMIFSGEVKRLIAKYAPIVKTG